MFSDRSPINIPEPRVVNLLSESFLLYRACILKVRMRPSHSVLAVHHAPLVYNAARVSLIPTRP